MYEFTARLRELYGRLQDERSRELFWARMRYDLEPRMESALVLASLRSGLSPEQAASSLDWRETFRDYKASGKKIVLYGASATGQLIASYLFQAGLDFYAFCARRAERFPNGVMGKAVYPPEWLFEHAGEVYVVIAANNEHHKEIGDILEAHQFPEGRILPLFPQLSYVESPLIYFEFPQLIRRGTAFIDGGCYNGADSIRFAQYTGGDYSEIFALEPDPVSAEQCRRCFSEAGLERAKVIEAGLAERQGSVGFMAAATQGSCVLENVDAGNRPAGYCEVATVRIDDIAAEQAVGMIKMDIEGSEMSALRGGAETIRRDRPLLALSVYHRVGDMPAIMDYCSRLVPEYRFWLRQYHGLLYDTVLYAAC